MGELIISEMEPVTIVSSGITSKRTSLGGFGFAFALGGILFDMLLYLFSCGLSVR